MEGAIAAKLQGPEQAVRTESHRRDVAELLREHRINRDDWNSWRWQVKNKITTVDALRSWVEPSDDELEAIERCHGKYRWSISPYYASLMDPVDPLCPIRQQAIPQLGEFEVVPSADVDPVDDQFYRRTNRVIHKYPDRVAFLVTAMCPVYCRHCTRKYHTTDYEGTYFATSEAAPTDEDIAYLNAHPEIRDVSLSGGDPLSYHDHQLERIIAPIRAIPHIEIIRIGSRLPVLLPQRITEEFCALLDRYGPFWVNTHFNHPKEVTEEAADACDRLLRHGVPVGNQSVLLRGVNDDVPTMRTLVRQLVRIKVRPYYLYHCDHVTGVAHFATTIEKGLEIMEGLIGHTTGFAVPQYVLTTRIGKIPMLPQYVSQTDEGGYRVRNWRAEEYDVPWPI